ncbi:hypothetical protein H4R33_000409 [Dimargaris cristalligena]|nr:hypothetical protein H4R33_000409 [Dimargaris cristalligena]
MVSPIGQTARRAFLIGVFFVLAGIGLFIGSRVVRYDYYDDRISYRSALVRYHALTWSGVVAFILGCGIVGYGFTARKRELAKNHQAAYHMYPPGPHGPPPGAPYYAAPPPAYHQQNAYPPPPGYEPALPKH